MCTLKKQKKKTKLFNVVFGERIAPVEESLSNHGTDGYVIVGSVGRFLSF